jgi:hypothetical protein
MSRNQDLTIKRGTTYPLTIHFTDANGDPIDLTGATVYFTAKSVEYDVIAADTSAVISKDVTVHLDEAGDASATDGITTILLTDNDTYVTPGNYYYDITVKYLSGVINTPIEGKLKIDGKPTNRAT